MMIWTKSSNIEKYTKFSIIMKDVKKISANAVDNSDASVRCVNSKETRLLYSQIEFCIAWSLCDDLYDFKFPH